MTGWLRSGSALLPVLLLAGAGCRKSEPPPPPAPVDCQEDAECFLRRVRDCQPASVRQRTQYTVEGQPVQVRALYEVVGLVRGKCHVRRTQVEPPLPPDAGKAEEESYPPSGLEPPRVVDYPRPGVPLPPLLQCLYEVERGPDALQRVWRNAANREDLDPCYPGDGSCDRLPIPLLGPGCTIRDSCLLGRFTFDCEDLKDPRHPVYICEGTRLSDENPGCFLFCLGDNRQVLSCDTPGTPYPQEKKFPFYPLSRPDAG